MAKTRPTQLLLPFFTEACYVCWRLLSEGDRSGVYLPPKLTGHGLCASHLARLQEGACLFCGRRLAWLRMTGSFELAICRPCFVDRKRAAVARALEEDSDGDVLDPIV